MSEVMQGKSDIVQMSTTSYVDPLKWNKTCHSFLLVGFRKSSNSLSFKKTLIFTLGTFIHKLWFCGKIPVYAYNFDIGNNSN